ncbi:MAG: hypothetical protein ACR2HL_06170 [Methylocystis sp.]
MKSVETLKRCNVLIAPFPFAPQAVCSYIYSQYMSISLYRGDIGHVAVFGVKTRIA